MPVLNTSSSWRRLAALLLLGGAMAPLLWAQSSIYQLELAGLQSNTVVKLADYRGRWLLLSFFEPQCSWCQRQMRAFSELVEDCGERVQPLLVGINGRDDALREELRRAKVALPAGRANRQLLAVGGEVAATPTTLVFAPDGQQVARLQGYYSRQKFVSAFADICTVGPY